MNAAKRFALGYLQPFSFFGALVTLVAITAIWLMNNFIIMPMFDTTTVVWDRACTTKGFTDKGSAILDCGGEPLTQSVPPAIFVEVIGKGGRLDVSCKRILRMPSERTEYPCKITWAEK